MLLPLVLALAALPVVPRGSTVAVDPLGRGSWVVDEETDAVLLIPRAGAIHRIEVGRWPERLVLDSRGRVFVSCRQAGEIDVIALDFSVRAIPVGAEPSALYLDEPRQRLFTGLITARELVSLDTASLQVIARRKIDLEPAALELTPEGLAVLARRGGEVGYFTPELEGDWWVALPPSDSGARGWFGVALAAVGTDLFVVHTEVETGLGKVGFGDGYGGGAAVEPVTTLVSVLRRAKPLRAIEELRMLDVTGIAVEANRVAFSVRGSGSVVLGTWNPQLEEFDARGIRAGEGLSGVAFDGDGSMIALAAFDRRLVRTGVHRSNPVADRVRTLVRQVAAGNHRSSLGLLGLLGGGSSGGFGEFAGVGGARTEFDPALSPTLTLTIAEGVALPPGRFDPELALGRKLFHAVANERISSNSLGCVSCHPDGREDGLVWRLQGTRRQTPLLAGRLADTAPYNWKGTGKTLERNIAHTTQRLQGVGLSAAQRKALARYLVEGLRPVTMPPIDAPAKVARGSEVFHDPAVGCATCHPSDDGFTDGALHDVASLADRELNELRQAGALPKDAKQFDSPDLRRLAVTAPYFHDGSRATLEALIDENDDRMGHTSSLSPDDRAALAAYLRSL